MSQRMPSGRFLGRKKDDHDQRDLTFAYRPGTRLMGPQPSKTNNLSDITMPPIFDQGQEGSCTANAGIRWFNWLALRFPDAYPNFTPRSRQAQYYWERALPWNNDVGEDSGAGTRDIFTVLRKIGACPEEDDPYRYSTLSADPGDKAVQDAAAFRIKSDHAILSLSDMKHLLMMGWTGTIGMNVYPSLDEVGEDGIWSPDASREQCAGGHEVFIHDYDDSVNDGSILADNSWGESFGRQGQFWIPYRFLEDYSASRWDARTGSFNPPRP